jgi:hypothetical protein
MPLPGVGDTVKQCTARAKHSGARCRNPAVVCWGGSGRVCRMHGARKAGTVRRGVEHPQYRHGEETLEAKAERSRKLAELRDLEALSCALGIVSGPRWRGRKPKSP